MRKSELNSLLRSYARDKLSPTPVERSLVSTVYDSVQAVLGQPNCLQIGSYPRFTAVTPLHDLDILYVLGPWNAAAHDPAQALGTLQSRFSSEYRNPTPYRVDVSRQTHSIVLTFTKGTEEVFAVDIVPAYRSGKNEFGDDRYMVPEIAASSRGDRRRILAEVAKGARQMSWIRSDPRGYITVASRINESNEDFRRSVKLVKGWRMSCKDMDADFPLKSFHIEQAITREFQRTAPMEIFDAVFKFFCDLPDLIARKQIPDRADSSQMIDSYIEDITDEQKTTIIQARDFFLIKLENISEDANVADLVQAGRHERASKTEAYLFDSRIPVLTEGDFSVTAKALSRSGGFREKLLDRLGLIEVDRKIEFRQGRNAPTADVYKWKVKNDNSSPEPRGEITDHRTRNDPESTKYSGRHHVECFAIRDGVCIGRSRQNVVLQHAFGR